MIDKPNFLNVGFGFPTGSSRNYEGIINSLNIEMKIDGEIYVLYRTKVESRRVKIHTFYAKDDYNPSKKIHVRVVNQR